MASPLSVPVCDSQRQRLHAPLSQVKGVGPTLEKKLAKAGIVSKPKERNEASRHVQDLDIRTPSVEQKVANLSGGNQQKVVLAKWLATRPRVLLLDEPTRGIDVNAKNQIYRLIHELARAGLAIGMISSELPEIMAIAHRIIVLSEGRQTAEFSRSQATEESILKAALFAVLVPGRGGGPRCRWSRRVLPEPR